jgi:hypothetical protein
MSMWQGDAMFRAPPSRAPDALSRVSSAQTSVTLPLAEKQVSARLVGVDDLAEWPTMCSRAPVQPEHAPPHDRALTICLIGGSSAPTSGRVGWPNHAAARVLKGASLLVAAHRPRVAG